MPDEKEADPDVLARRLKLKAFDDLSTSMWTFIETEERKKSTTEKKRSKKMLQTFAKRKCKTRTADICKNQSVKFWEDIPWSLSFYQSSILSSFGIEIAEGIVRYGPI
ncbi:unnamed protein product [Haemonchus placei]|uniref:Uncharacterized protein n=1 Tax=Haemonchus placei TaxID=6290 RepID=A0A0N4XA76_HAEPC|nr:unnamed protein product [Haemonchus placei]